DPRAVIKGAVIQQTAGLFLLHAAPLLEEKWNPCVFALLPDRLYPILFHGPSTRTAFSAHDHPMNSGKVDLSEILQQRFDGKKANGCGRGPQVVDARQSVLSIFNAAPPP